MKLSPFLRSDGRRAQQGLFVWINPHIMQQLGVFLFSSVILSFETSSYGVITFPAEVLSESFIEEGDILISELLYNGIPLLSEASTVDITLPLASSNKVEMLRPNDDLHSSGNHVVSSDKLSKTPKTIIATSSLSPAPTFYSMRHFAACSQIIVSPISLHLFSSSSPPLPSSLLSPPLIRDIIPLPSIPFAIGSLILPELIPRLARRLLLSSGMFFPVLYLSKIYTYYIELVPFYTPFSDMTSGAIASSSFYSISSDTCIKVSSSPFNHLSNLTSPSTLSSSPSQQYYSLFYSEVQEALNSAVTSSQLLASLSYPSQELSPNANKSIQTELRRRALERRRFQASALSDSILFLKAQLEVPLLARKALCLSTSTSSIYSTDSSVSLSLSIPTFLITGDSGLGKTFTLNMLRQYFINSSSNTVPDVRVISLPLIELIEAVKTTTLVDTNFYNDTKLDEFSQRIITQSKPVESTNMFPPAVVRIFSQWTSVILASVVVAGEDSNRDFPNICLVFDDIDALNNPGRDLENNAEEDGEFKSNSTPELTSFSRTLVVKNLLEFLKSLPVLCEQITEKLSRERMVSIKKTKLPSSQVRYAVIATAVREGVIPIEFTKAGLFLRSTYIAYPSLEERCLIFLHWASQFVNCVCEITPTFSDSISPSKMISIHVSPLLHAEERDLLTICSSSRSDSVACSTSPEDTHFHHFPRSDVVTSVYEFFPQGWLLDSKNTVFLRTFILPYPGLFSLCVRLARLTAGEPVTSLYSLFSSVLSSSLPFSIFSTSNTFQTSIVLNGTTPAFPYFSPVILDASEALLAAHGRKVLLSNSSSRSLSQASVSSLDSIAGYSSLVQDLRSLASQWRRPLAGSRLGVSPPSGLLLTGPAGVGKTLMARALASETAFSLINLSCADVFQRYLGESERVVRETFRQARLAAPSVLLIDQLETIAPNRSIGGGATGVQTRILSTLLNELDGVEERIGVFVIATTRGREMVDAALLRPGRLDRVVCIPLPDAHSREAIFAKYASVLPFSSDEMKANATSIVVQQEGISGARIQSICKNSMSLAIREAAMIRQNIHAFSNGKTSLNETDCPRNDYVKLPRSISDSVKAIQKPGTLDVLDEIISSAAKFAFQKIPSDFVSADYPDLDSYIPNGVDHTVPEIRVTDSHVRRALSETSFLKS